MLDNVNNMDNKYAMIDLTQGANVELADQYQESLLGADGGASPGEIRDSKAKANMLLGELRVQQQGDLIDDEAALQARKETLSLATI